MRPLSSRDPTAGSDFTWNVRVRTTPGGHAVASARTNLFTICGQASFKEADPHPSAVEYLLGILGGDLLSGFSTQASRRSILVYALEATVSGRLNNPLVQLGVIGEQGHAGLEAISGTVYVSADAEEVEIQRAWEETLLRSPLVKTLERAVALSLTLRQMP